MRMRPLNCVLHISAEPKFTQEDVLNKKWLEAFKSENRSQMISATDYKLVIVDTATLYVRKGYLQIRVLFGAVRQLVVTVLLRTYFTEKFVRWILSDERKVVLHNSATILILFWRIVYLRRQRTRKNERAARKQIPDLQSTLTRYTSSYETHVKLQWGLVWKRRSSWQHTHVR